MSNYYGVEVLVGNIWQPARRKVTGVERAAGFRIYGTANFSGQTNAIKVARELHDKHNFRSRVMHQGKMVWESRSELATSLSTDTSTGPYYWSIQVWTTSEGWTKPPYGKYKNRVSYAEWSGNASVRFSECKQWSHETMLGFCGDFVSKNPGVQARLIRHQGDETDCDVFWSGARYTSPSITTKDTEGDTTEMTPDLNKPLTIERETLIAKLNENLAAEVAKREKAEADRAAERQEILDLIATFTPDELYNIFASNYTTDPAALKFDKEHKSYVTNEIKPTQTETDLEKFARVLEMATDKTLELTPNESLYKLL